MAINWIDENTLENTDANGVTSLVDREEIQDEDIYMGPFFPVKGIAIKEATAI